MGIIPWLTPGLIKIAFMLIVIQTRKFLLIMFKKITQNNNGAGLFEMVIATTLFSILVLSATQIFKMVVEGQRSAIAAQNIQESMRYAYETMAKEIRMAQKSDDECESIVAGATATHKIYNTETSGGNDVLYFKNKNADCVAYYLEDGYLMVYRGLNKIASTTPHTVKINSLSFNIVDDEVGAFHSIQPLVTMMMNIEVGGKEMHKQRMDIQTTISSRYYE